VTRNLKNVAPAPRDGDDPVWELFHETCKMGSYDDFPPQELLLERMKGMQESLDFDMYPAIPLPRDHAPLRIGLSEALLTRVSARSLRPCRLGLEEVGTLLHHAYGVTRDNAGSGFPRPFRAAPSAGALYPLELFLHSRCIEGAPPGLYHYNPMRNEIRRVLDDDQSPSIAKTFIPFQSHLALDAALLVFLTALFGRSTFKYATRGYRFVLLEAGPVAQTLNLAASGLGLASLNIGGYFDRRLDEFLGLDGLTHSAIYVVAIGGRGPATD
jgi:SagB-type dehydrogenase family enzyme